MLVASLLILQGCRTYPAASSATVPLSKSQEIATQYSAKAMTFESEGDLYQAFRHWQIVLTVSPQSSVAQENVARLESKIRGERDYFLSQAQAHLGNGNAQAAVPLLLSALAVAPDDTEIARKLQTVHREIAVASLRTQPKKTSMAKDDVGNASIEQKFELGLSLISTDKEKARQLFEAVLKADPNHLAARAYLEVLSGD